MKEETYKAIEKALANAEEEIAQYNERKYGSRVSEWIIPRCPDSNCYGILGHMFGSRNLVCMKCDKEFELRLYEPSEKTVLNNRRNR